MRFSPRLPNDTATLLLVASLHHRAGRDRRNSAHDPAAHHVQTISIVGAVALLVVYGIWVRQYLDATDAPADECVEAADGSDRDERHAAGHRPASAPAFVSDWFVHALEPTIHSAGISHRRSPGS